METFWTGGIVVLALVNLLYLLVLLAVVRQLGILLVRLGPATARVTAAGPQVGSVFEPVTLTDVQGRPVRIGPTKHEATLLVFISPRCEACHGLLPSLEPFARQYRDVARVITVSTISDQTAADAATLGALGPTVTLVRDRTFAEGLQIGLTPYAVVIGADGRVLSKGIANSLEQLESLLDVETFRPRGLVALAAASGAEK